MKQTLSKFILAVTVDEPSAETPSNSNDNPAASADSSTTTKPTETKTSPVGDNGSAETVNPNDATGKSETAGVANNEAAPDLDGERTANGTTEDAKSGGEGTKPAKKSVGLNPNGPKCVQIKMKPDWRGQGIKRRRGDLARAGPGGGGRWAWPENRPEFCRFVLYKENMDTVSTTWRPLVACRTVALGDSFPISPHEEWNQSYGQNRQRES